MPFIMHFEYPGIDAQQYEEAVEKVELETDGPEGMLFHVAGPMEGGWQVIDVWESEEAWHRFRDEKLKAHGWETKDPDSAWPLHTVWGNDVWLHKIPHGG